MKCYGTLLNYLLYLCFECNYSMFNEKVIKLNIYKFFSNKAIIAPVINSVTINCFWQLIVWTITC